MTAPRTPHTGHTPPHAGPVVAGAGPPLPVVVVDRGSCSCCVEGRWADDWRTGSDSDAHPRPPSNAAAASIDNDDLHSEGDSEVGSAPQQPPSAVLALRAELREMRRQRADRDQQADGVDELRRQVGALQEQVQRLRGDLQRTAVCVRLTHALVPLRNSVALQAGPLADVLGRVMRLQLSHGQSYASGGSLATLLAEAYECGVISKIEFFSGVTDLCGQDPAGGME
jgi:hypothetical protein